MPASRTAESLPTSSYESYDAAKNDAEIQSRSMEYERMQLSVGLREQKKPAHAYTEDASYVSPNKTVYGVFDGVGGSKDQGGNPAAAAQVAAESMGELLSTSRNEVTSHAEIIDQLEAALEYGRREVAARGEGGMTVGTIVKFYNYDGRSVAGVAHAGDTRLFHYSNARQTYTPITPDQSTINPSTGNYNIITNGLFDHAKNAPDYCDAIAVQPGDKLMLCSDGITGDNSNQSLSDAQFMDAFSQPTADAAAQRFLELSKKNDDKTVVVINIDEKAAASDAPKARLTPEETQAMVKMRKNKKAENGQKRKMSLSDRMRIVAEGQKANTEEVTQSNLAPSSAVAVTPLVMARPNRKPKHAAVNTPEVSVRNDEAAIDEERQYEIDMQRGFTVVDKRKRSREELLNTPLDELISSIDASKITKRSAPKHALTDADQETSTDAPSVDEVTPVAEDVSATLIPVTEELGVHGPMNRVTVTRHYNVPPKPDRDPAVRKHTPTPDHDPTVHLDGVDHAGDQQSDADKSSYKDALRNPFKYLSSRLSAAYFMHKNKREAAGKSREYFGLDADKQEKAAKVALGVVALSLVTIAAWKLDMELRDSVDASVIPNGYTGPNKRAIEAAEVAAQHAEVLNSPANIIPSGGGGIEFAKVNGADQSLWYQNQAEFLQKFPKEGYIMPDGNVGFARPGELSDAAKKFWAQKFGKWL